MTRKTPEVIEVDDKQLKDVVRRAEKSLDQKDAALIRAVFESYAYVSELVDDKNTSIRRLRQLFFGARTEKTDAMVGRTANSQHGAASSEPSAEDSDDDESDESGATPQKKGHGRHRADAYRGALQCPSGKRA